MREDETNSELEKKFVPKEPMVSNGDHIGSNPEDSSIVTE